MHARESKLGRCKVSKKDAEAVNSNCPLNLKTIYWNLALPYEKMPRKELREMHEEKDKPCKLNGTYSRKGGAYRPFTY